MTSEYPVFFNPVELTTSTDTLYTVPSGKTLRDFYLKVSNYTASAATVTVYNVPTGDTAADDTTSVKDYPVAAKDFVLIPICRMAGGGTIQTVASANTTLVAAPHGGRLFTP